MPSNVSTRLNDTVNTSFTAAELNGTTNPVLAVTFELQAGMVFNFQGVVAEVATAQTAPGTFTFLVFGDEKLQVLPSDNFITLRARGAGTESFYFSRAEVDFTERHYSVRDLFPFKNQRFEPGFYTFFLGIIGTLNADAVVTLTVYGTVESITQKDFPWEQR